MAGGIARGRIRTTTTMDDVGHTPNNRLVDRDIQPWFTVYFFDIGHLFYDQSTPVKSRYPLTSIM